MSRKKLPTILAIETSADETSAAVFAGGQIKSNIIYSQVAEHQKTGGIVPEVAARAHVPKIIPAIQAALQEAGVKLLAVDAVAVTAGPGLITSLLIGTDTAKALAFALAKPVIPVNHLEGHLLSAFADWRSENEAQTAEFFPAVGLIVSGGHTMLVLVEEIGKYTVLGETLDDAAGEAFDKIAKILGLSYPGGPEMAKLAEQGKPDRYEMPRPLLDRDSYDFSFSGLKTHVLYFLRDNPKVNKADVAASVEQAIVDVLSAKTIRAAREHKAKTILLGGGVAANKKLRQTLEAKTKTETPDSSLLVPGPALSTDNAGMIALAANYHYLNDDATTFDQLRADPNLQLKSWR